MKRKTPPRWMEWTLRFLLPERDRETVVGDLREEFAERAHAETGTRHATRWYLLQVFSFAPRRIASAFVQPLALSLLCVFSAMSGTWLGIMDLRMQHPGYAGREVIAATIVAEAVLTLVALRYRHPALRAVAMTGTAAIVYLSFTALIATVRGSHLEGYVLLIALTLLLQSLLTLFTLRSPAHKQSRRT